MAKVRVRMNADGLVALRRETDVNALRPIGDAVAEDARRYVPVLSGDLRGTIRVRYLDGEVRVYFGNVGSGIDYHLYQEFGTSKMAAQPYMRPALYKRRGGTL